MAALLQQIRHVPARVLDVFLLRRAESRARAFSPAQQANVKRLHQAALVRLTSARRLRDASEIIAAGTLYREAALLAARAAVVAHDAEARDDLDAEQAFARLKELASETDPNLSEAQRLATDPNRLAIDELGAIEARERLERVDRALGGLLGTIEPRSVRRIRISRVLRLGAVALVALGAIVALILWLLAPKNVARGKPATAISYWPGSAPADALVNGKHESPWGSGTGLVANAWFQIDLLDSHEIERVVVVNRDDGYSYTSAPFVIETSEDGTTFTRIARFEAPATAGQRWVHTGGGSGRYVRVRRDGGRGFALSEIEIYGKKR